MLVAGKVCVVTGGGGGIGRALCRRFAREGLAGLVIADINGRAAEETAHATGGIAVRADVTLESDLENVAGVALSHWGRVDIFCSNAGVFSPAGLEASPQQWQRSWQVNVGAHISAARLVLPSMLARRQGCLLQTIAAAGLLTMIGSAPYSVTKHAALAFAEWLAITYGNQGVQVAALCPLGVKTEMLDGQTPVGAWLAQTAVSPEQVAESALAGIQANRFLYLPHPEVHEFFQRKASDHDRWLSGMRRLQEQVYGVEPKV